MSVRVNSVGDLMFGRDIPSQNLANIGALLGKDVANVLYDCDILTGNLECVVGQGDWTPNPVSHSHFQCEPSVVLPFLKKFDVVSFANNHCYDYGCDGLESTLEHLQSIKLPVVGVGENQEEAVNPAVIYRDTKSVAFFGATTVSTIPKGKTAYCCAKPGKILDEAISDARRKYDYVLLHLHTGGGDYEHPAPFVRDLHQHYRKMSIDVIFGHHPHVVHGWHVDSNTVSFYSLGDFLFDRFNDNRDLAIIGHVQLSEKSHKCDISTVKRAPDFSLDLDERTDADLYGHLNQALESGDSDKLFDQWYGSPITRTVKSLGADYRAGGVRAVAAKFWRLDRAKLLALFSAMTRRFKAIKKVSE